MKYVFILVLESLHIKSVEPKEDWIVYNHLKLKSLSSDQYGIVMFYATRPPEWSQKTRTTLALVAVRVSTVPAFQVLCQRSWEMVSLYFGTLLIQPAASEASWVNPFLPKETGWIKVKGPQKLLEIGPYKISCWFNMSWPIDLHGKIPTTPGHWYERQMRLVDSR